MEPSFISSDTTILISFISQSTPNLFKSIIEYSKVGSRETIPEEPTLVTASQIKSAQLHASGIMHQALHNIAKIQEFINSADEQLKKLIEQRNLIENDLISLMSLKETKIEEKEEEEEEKSLEEIPEQSVEELKKYLIELNLEQENLKKIINTLQGQLEAIDELLPIQTQSWSEHREKYVEILASELEKKHGITLTSAEKIELNSTNTIAIQEKTEKLLKLGVKLPKNPSDFMISAYGIVFAAKSRELQKPEHIEKIIKSLSTIKDEDKAAQKLKSQFEKEYETIATKIVGSHQQSLEVKGLSDPQLARVTEIGEKAKKISLHAEQAAKKQEKSQTLN